MKKFVVTVGIILAALFFYYAVTTYSPRIQSDILEKAQGSIRENGLAQSVAAFADGRDVVLDGFVSSETEKQLTEDRILSLPAVRVVTNNLQVKAPEQDITIGLDGQIETPVSDDVTQTISEIEEGFVKPSVDLSIPNMPTDIGIEGFGERDLLAPPEQNFEQNSEQNLEQENVSQPVDGNISVNGQVENLEAEEVLETQKEQATILPVQELIAKVSEASRCQERVSKVVAGQRVNFETGKTVIKEDSFDLLQRVAEAVDGCDSVSVQVHGHTDNVGDADANRKLSHARAKAVGIYLLKSGVVQEVRVFGHGADRPIASNDTDEGRAQNRRIEFKVVALQSEPKAIAKEQEGGAQ